MIRNLKPRKNLKRTNPKRSVMIKTLKRKKEIDLNRQKLVQKVEKFLKESVRVRDRKVIARKEAEARSAADLNALVLEIEIVLEKRRVIAQESESAEDDHSKEEKTKKK